jgi:purine nucleoside phosphorylase
VLTSADLEDKQMGVSIAGEFSQLGDDVMSGSAIEAGQHLHPTLISLVPRAEDIGVVRDGTYVRMEGPQFSSLAESLTYKKLGYSVIGMTNMPEAKLAREAEICYATPRL